MKIRARISQFIILPCFQGQGAGQLLYSRICKHLRAEEQVGEITVEDGNEEFSRLRMKVDVALLKSIIPTYSESDIVSLPDKQIIEFVRIPFKWPLKHFVKVFNKATNRKRPLPSDHIPVQ